jgi:hypothetical protein
MSTDSRRTRAWVLTALVTAVGCAIGIIYYPWARAHSTAALEAPAILSAVLIVWLAFNDAGKRRRAMRTGSLLVGVPLLIGGITAVAGIQAPPAWWTISSIVALGGSALGIWAFWTARTGRVSG